MAVKEITDADFEEVTGKGVTLTDFWATWCGPCKMQSPVVEQLSDEMSDVSFTKMDVDQNPETAAHFGIMSIPTLMVKKDGEVVDTVVGYHPKDQLKQILEQYTD
ncbi:Thiol-disulfide isomerase and thioredoxin [Ligilactobacillus acidipiscis DSM 15836]|jgi:thioredoxin 1|uniref:Thioredoxin n=2 Tax=Ligilactobacillus acidipiscis TaxID=89059 RepID=A0A0R2K2B3_9LACO|nr:thioredoxin [Ligilactobacillus acidipiscis]KRM31240.1 Thiol-disulfide isomerase and thioredoxin [Ligilactobacillus acidipiscis DSM 15836]KRN80599.1 Thiol-disulfide isomerase and thioredoxin [Ligilactobacillus acidipiscis]MCI1924004.1 thioredoxin [Ligilactobacillus acidipiscis]MCI1953530.1 thioredoxin [Ligilactobacillus acidipiscis]WEV56673.1 thioredoxin [Ligilactobacillus acidipiscis]